jgi:hypothetical protein
MRRCIFVSRKSCSCLFYDVCEGTLLGVTSPLRRRTRSCCCCCCWIFVALAIIRIFLRTELSRPLIMVITTSLSVTKQL